MSKLLVVEDLETTSTRDLADSGGMEAMVVITVTALDKNAGVTEALCIYLPSYVVQVNAWLRERTGGQDFQTTVMQEQNVRLTSLLLILLVIVLY